MNSYLEGLGNSNSKVGESYGEGKAPIEIKFLRKCVGSFVPHKPV